MSQVATQQSKGLPSPAQFRERVTQISNSLLTDWVGPERAKEATGRIAAAVSASAAAAKDPTDFYSCTPQSIGTVVAISALTGIMPSTGAAALAYAVPQRARVGEPPQLQYMLSHRGLNALARRCGQTMIAIPISLTDQVDTDDSGMFRIVSRDMDNPPTKMDELRGVMIIVKELATGLVTMTAYVPKKLILARMAMSRSAKSTYSPWATWPIEMAQKTAMHYAVGRGWCVIDDTEAVRALSADVDSDLDRSVLDVLPQTKGISRAEKVAKRLEAPADEVEQPITDVEPVQEPEPAPVAKETAKPAKSKTLIDEAEAAGPTLDPSLEPFREACKAAKDVAELAEIMDKLPNYCTADKVDRRLTSQARAYGDWIANERFSK